ncbi:MAG: hypothetical protein Q8S33_00705 [Myxococcales bacterium]|nr:hypothetical protein [Myxococcales bacterium]MDP3498811.1 hypothetical protein [Myxococcales bacterium]
MAHREAVTRWASRLERFSVEDTVGRSVLDTIPRSLEWQSANIARVRFTQGSFDTIGCPEGLGVLGIPVDA